MALVRFLYSSQTIGLAPASQNVIVDKNTNLVDDSTMDDVVFQDDEYLDKIHTLGVAPETLLTVAEAQAPSQRAIGAFLANANGSGSSWVPWSLIYSQKAFKRLLECIQVEFESRTLGGNLNYYRNYFRKQDPFFTSMRRLCFSRELLRTKRKELESYMHFFASFIEDRDQRSAPEGCAFANVIKYNRSSTVTGRLTTASGPNLLLLPKEHRDVVQSVFGELGEVIVIDLKSLEPRLALIANGKTNIPTDVYEYVKDECQVLGKLPRETIKPLVVDTLYGSGRDSLEKKFPTIPFDYVEPAIDSIFGIAKRRKELLAEARSNGEQYLTNRFGRRVSIVDAKPYKFLNRVTQSAATDLAIMLFLELVSELQLNHPAWKIRPIGLIHDALVLDVTRRVLQDIQALSTLRLSDPTNPFYGFSFPITVTKFNA